ncbi:hypothetical protein B0H34DRAFT_8658 [Crassisporium funariophilum]|nr:hypothetical protein B0H34DRAFT_8658 [Crassisporium funariophilum]
MHNVILTAPTHNLTLTRTAMELVELDLKLRHTHTSVKIPTLPINPDTLPTPPPKRKSTFLNTLSRLASPTAAKAHRQSSSSRRNTATSVPSLTTPITSPAVEVNDPFGSFTSSNGDSPTDPAANSTVTATTSSATSTAIASYLTTISNIPALRLDRVWKRFVRVRTDDLESVRVERAIKRVRSDLAAHVGSLSKENSRGGGNRVEMDGRSADPSEVGSQEDDHEERKVLEESVLGPDAAAIKEAWIKEEEEEEEVGDKQARRTTYVDLRANNATDSTTTQTPSGDVLLAGVTGDGDSLENPSTSVDVSSTQEEAAPSTPVATDAHPSRMHRSQSADPDKSSRLSRAYASSMPSQDGAESQTGDDSSSSAANRDGRIRKRKKRSASAAANKEPKKSQRKVVIDDFEMMRVLGKGCAGKVLLVRHKNTSDLFALKAITKRHVLAHQELQHTLTEQAVLKRMAAESRDPFVVKLWWSFHDKENLFLVMDFHPGGDLATQLARWGRLGRDRARFYAAEIVEGVEGLHAAGVIYRDLKPENILIGGDGHIVLTDFGLSKEFPRRNISSSAPITPSGSRGGEFYSSVPGTPQQPATPPWMTPDRSGELALGWPGQPIGHTDSTKTFCGTAEYLAPEVIQGLRYSYEVDWWSFGTMLYEMLTGITPFWADNHSDMYVRVLQDELQFPDDRAIDQDTKSLIRGLLQRVPSLRICEPRIKRHPYFSMIDWSHVYYKRYIPPYIPPIDPSNASDTQNFDETFLDMEPVLDDFNEDEAINENEATDTDQEPQTDTDRTDGEETNTTPSQSRSSSIRPQAHLPIDEDVDVFDGYSFKGRHSVLIDDDEEDEESSSGEESIEDETDNLSILKGLEQEAAHIDGNLLGDRTSVEDDVEPKTPEGRPAALPVDEAPPPVPNPEEVVEALRTEEAPVEKATVHSEAEALAPNQATGRVTPPSKPVVPRQAAAPATRVGRSRREKSGVPALDRHLENAIDEDTEATEAEREEDDDWDFVEAADGEDRNGAKGNSLFARGVVDRYRLAVFRKSSTPTSRSAPRSVSGMSAASGATEVTESPSPTQRRGRTPGLTFRKNPRQFLRPKSPPSSFSAKSARSMSQTASTSNSLSVASNSTGGMLTPSLSVGSTFAMSPSLKSKESAISVGAQSQSSGQSTNGTSAVFVEAADTIRGSPQYMGAQPKLKNKKLKKYKNNAEKVFSLFSSPRQAS